MDLKTFLHSPEGQARLLRISTVARQAAASARAHPNNLTVFTGGRSFHAMPGGYCDRFAREVHEAAFRLGEFQWEFHAGSAHATEKLLMAKHRGLSGCVAGAIGFWDDRNKDGEDVGHVVVYVGGNLVCENTSSGKRGDPLRSGTKCTPLPEVVAAHHGDPGRWYYGGPLG